MKNGYHARNNDGMVALEGKLTPKRETRNLNIYRHLRICGGHHFETPAYDMLIKGACGF